MDQKFMIITDPNTNSRVILNLDHIVDITLKLEAGTGNQQVAITMLNDKTFSLDMEHDKIIKIIRPIDPVEQKPTQSVGFQTR